MVAPTGEAWTKTVHWCGVASELVETPARKKVPEWLKQLLIGAGGGILIGLLLGLGLLGVV